MCRQLAVVIIIIPLWYVVALELVVELFHWGMNFYHLLSSGNTLHKLVVDQDIILVEDLHKMFKVHSDIHVRLLTMANIIVITSC